MFLRVLALMVTTVLLGCARNGLDFASVSQSTGAPKNGQARIVVLLEKGYAGVLDQGYPVALDGEAMANEDGHVSLGRPPGRPSPAFSGKWDFPGVTRQEITVAPGRTYFFLCRRSPRGNAVALAGLAGMALSAASGDSNPGPVEFGPLDDAAGRQAISELRLAN